ncbi:DUF2490 domain-containing protein [Epilithonimonas tenax]|uniref:DUF2490 domain-containing protein n=1 Tax=Epilithonimonas tenax TaxID=191577 RepID=UPI00041B46F0|nr:DUF2490 domain-containing protein [Epilithonimonas tenax]
MFFSKTKLLFSSIFLVLISQSVFCQNRISNHNNIGWYAYNGTFKLDSKFSIHTEYQWRRNDYIETWQQSLLRLGINYQANPNLQLRLGYAWAETFPYGEIPINGMGKDFTEHRIYEMATVTDKIGKIDLSHRFMLEQRWVGRYSNADLTSEDQYPFLNRARYMIRLQMPLKGNSIADKTPYVAVYDELMIGFGKNVGENIFDQNRIGVLVGYKFNNLVRVEGGYLNQIVQLGREMEGKNVFQYNNGFIVSANFTFDLSKKSKE